MQPGVFTAFSKIFIDLTLLLLTVLDVIPLKAFLVRQKGFRYFQLQVISCIQWRRQCTGGDGPRGTGVQGHKSTGAQHITVEYNFLW